MAVRLRRGVAPLSGLLRAVLLLSCGALACSTQASQGRDVREETPDEAARERSDALVSYDCAESTDTGYSSGNPFPITVVTVDGNPVELQTANAFLTMAEAADAAGVHIAINSGFRTMAEQEYLYGCYVNCSCNSCNLAAKPGYSNHQSGHALDLNTSAPGVLDWLNANGGAFGFSRTVPSEPWHWEWWGGGAPKAFCGDCDRSAGGFTFSCNGPNSGLHCVQVGEPGDPDSWGDNHFCSEEDLGMKWSYAGPIVGMECTGIHEGAEAQAGAWADNFLCVPPQSAYRFTWSSAGPIAGQSCVHWNEPADPHSWGDNFLCSTPVIDFSAGGFTFSGDGPNGGLYCVLVDEPGDPDSWGDNHFCSEEDLGMKWSYAGPIEGMTCTGINEGAEAEPVWADNFLCLPPDSLYTFTWSSAGPVAGKTCVRWYEHLDKGESWQDNWLCFDKADPPAPGSAGAGGQAGASGQASAAGTAQGGGQPGGAGAPGQPGSGAAGAGSAGAGVGGKQSAGGNATSAGGGNKSGATSGGSERVVTLDDSSSAEGSCAIGGRGGRGAAVLLAALGVAAARRRRAGRTTPG